MFKGVFTAIVTPFKDNIVDEKSLEKIIEFQIKNGVAGIVPCGSTGESATLSYEEHINVIKLSSEISGGRIKVIAGTGSNNTAEAVHLAREAEKCGIDGHLQITPYYNKPTQEGLYLHFKSVAQNCELPVILYNVPSRTSINMLPDTVIRLSKLSNIKGIKEASGSLEQVTAILKGVSDDFCVLSGDDAITLPLLAAGGHGVISTVSNIAPGEMAQMVEYFFKNDLKTARKLNFRLLPLIRSLFVETNPIPVKKALNIMGLIENEIRLPLTEASGAVIDMIKNTMKDFGILN